VDLGGENLIIMQKHKQFSDCLFLYYQPYAFIDTFVCFGVALDKIFNLCYTSLVNQVKAFIA